MSLSSTISHAARIEAPHRVKVESVEPHAPGPGQVRVRLEGCGVCASNLPAWEGRPWFSYPLPAGAPGHEGWGVIDAVGAGVTSVSVGERVAFLSGNAYAAHDFTTPGALVRLPGELGCSPFPGEPLGCAVNVVRRAGIESGQNIAVIGVGFIGAVVTKLAALAGARVVALSRRTWALNLADRSGASLSLDLSDAQSAAREARRFAGAAGFQRVIECVGSQDALDLATELCTVRSRLVIAGYHQDGRRHVDLQRWNWLGLDVINAHERDAAEYVGGMTEAVQLVLSGKLAVSELVTHEFPLHELGRAFETVVARPDGFLKAWVGMA